MGMWIRSQDNETLMKVRAVVIYDTVIKGIIDGGSCGTGELGRYSTKERAIEVLDEIQGIVFNNVTTTYKMPQE